MKIVLNYEIAAAFECAAGINVLPLKPYDKLALPVCAHADMLTCIIDKKVFSYSDYIEYNKEVFEEMKSIETKKFYKEAHRAYFMIDKYPENKSRFNIPDTLDEFRKYIQDNNL